MGITKEILKKADKLFEEAIQPNTKHASAKAFTSGLIEGAIDGAVIMYPVLIAGCIFWKNKALNK